MFRKEWPLIMYSLITQFAAGLFLFLAVYRFLLSGESGSIASIAITAPGMLFTGPVILLGIFLSLFHLGNPFRAYKSVNNIGSSWLSREVFFTGGFFALWFVSALIEKNIFSGTFLSSLIEKAGNASALFIWLTVAVGLLTVLSMSWIYYSTGVLGWFNLNTFTGFFGTMIIFGSVSSAVFIIVSGLAAGNVKELLVPSLVIALIVLAARFLNQFLLITKLKSVKDVWSMDNLVSSAPSMSDILPSYRIFTFIGLLLSFAGVALIFYIISAGAGAVVPLLTAAGVLVVAGELMVRTGFYSLGLAKEAE